MPSPLAGIRYTRRAGEFGVIDPRPCVTDERLRAYVRAPHQREALDADDFHALLAFCERSGVFGLRARDTTPLADALAAAALVDLERYDPRDFTISAPVAAAQELGADVQRLVEEACAPALPRTAETMRGAHAHDRRSRIVRTDRGAGMLPAWSSNTPDNLALVPRAIALARAVEATGRFFATVAGRSLESARGLDDSLLMKSQGFVCVVTDAVGGGASPWIDVARMPSPAEAAALADIWRADHELAFAEGVLAARSRTRAGLDERALAQALRAPPEASSA